MPRSAKIVPIAAPTPEPAVAAVPVPLADLYLSPLNPRQEHEPEGIAALAESLRTLGLMQNLAGLRDTDGRVGIVAGGRRLAALALAVEARSDLALVPVLLAPDEATARLWALAENTARASLHIVDEVRAYRRMTEDGATLPTIAAAFAVTEAHVRRRLKLASLPSPILDALKAGQIGVGHAQAFTLCPDEDRQLAALKDVVSRRLSEDSLRRILTQERVPDHDRRARFVGVEAYEAAGGTLTRDLFAREDEAFLDDPALLDRLFAEKLDALAEAKRAEGWKWCEAYPEAWLPWDLGGRMERVSPLPDPLSEEEEEELDALYELAEADELDEAGQARLEELDAPRPALFQPEHRAHAGGWLYVDRDGAVREALGYVRPEDKVEAVAAGVIDAPRAAPGVASEPATPKSPYSAALEADMKAIRLAAVQTALLAHPGLVLDLLSFAVSPESGWSSTPLAVQPERQPIKPTGEDGFAPDPRLADAPSPSYGPDDLDQAFEAFRAKGPEHRSTVLTEAFARTLRYAGGPNDRARGLFERIEREAGAQVRAVWRPTARNFFGRVSAATLDDLFKQLLDRDDSDPAFKSFKVLKKGEKALAMERLFADPEHQATWLVTPEQVARIAAWVPDCA